MLLGEGDEFAGYRILRTLGSGGMGEVYLAEHPRLPRHEALKLLRSDISADPEYRSRFEREAALASTLWHPNIVGLHDRGEYDGHLWITMDFVDGNNAADLMSTKYPDGMPTALAMQIVSAVAGALDYAHKKGLLHRDVKPANIIVTNIDDDGQSRVLLADFGIARHIDEVSGLTATNMTVGTVAYAAPEQLMGDNVDGRTDQYALAATAYQLLTGSQLYPHSNAAVVIGRHLNAAPPRLADRRPDLAAFDPAFAVALSKEPSQRFARAADFAAALTDPHVAGPHHFASAPTQTTPVTPPELASAPTVHPAVPTAGSPRRHAILASAAVATTIVVAAAIALWHPWDHAPTGGPPGGPAAGPANSGPFTGVYTADFGPEIELGTGKGLNGETARATLRVRSACTRTGCKAIANLDAPTINRSLIFDQIGDQWIAVATAPSASPLISKGLKAGCEQGLSPEVWESIAVKVQFDGPLNGDYEVADANNCNTSRTLHLTRTGDVDPATIDDPTTLPARKPNPASGFHGQYHYIHNTESASPVSADGTVNTYCLRTVARCMSYFNNSTSAEPFVFADGQWVMHYKGPARCGSPTAPRVTIDRTATLALPDPATDPIAVLSGNGHEQVDDSVCIYSGDFQPRFERTGD